MKIFGSMTDISLASAGVINTQMTFIMISFKKFYQICCIWHFNLDSIEIFKEILAKRGHLLEWIDERLITENDSEFRTLLNLD